MRHNTITVGIDPGVTGAMTLLSKSGGLLDIIDIPSEQWELNKNRRRVNAAELAYILSSFITPKKDVVFLEWTHAMPKNGSIAAYSQGDTSGVIRGVCAALQTEVRFVKPTEWKKYWGLIGGDKYQSLVTARHLFPNEPWDKKKYHNRAESGLIAMYGHEMRTIDDINGKIESR